MSRDKTMIIMLAVLLSLVAVFTVAVTADDASDSTSALSEIEEKGDCGEDMEWHFFADYDEYYDVTGYISLKDDGYMYDYEYGTAPWFPLKDRFEGVEIIPYWNLIVGPDDVSSIGKHAFQGTNVKSLGIMCANYDWGDETYSLRIIDDYAFADCSKLYYISDITAGEYRHQYAVFWKIGDYAFMNCTSLPEIHMDKAPNITYIGEGAFMGCTSLTTVDLAPLTGFTEILPYTFKNCSSLTEITLPASLKTIGQRAFEGCTSLQTIVIPEGVEEISVSAFEGCTSLKTIVIPNSVKIISASTFEGCTSLESVVLPADLTSIDVAAFDGCSSLKSFQWPSGIKTIENRVFKGCTSLTEFDFEGIESIKDWAFCNCTGIKNFVLPDTINYIGRGAFEGCSIEEFTIPATVTSISDFTFRNCTSLKTVNISDSVTLIDWEAFKGCTSLAEISLPGKLYRIEKNAFQDCTILNNVFIPDTVRIMGPGVFEGCVSLDNIKLPADIKEIPDYLFKDCTSLVFEFDGLESIGEGAFQGCSFVSVSIPDTVRSIGEGAFKGCKSLESAKLPADIKAIPANLFKDCTSLKSIPLPDGLEIIGAGAFQGCTSLVTIESPESLRTISEYAFDSCTSLKTAMFPANTESIAGRAFYGCESLETAGFNMGIESIGDSAFYGCVSLISVDLPESLAYIGNHAFGGCASLTAANFLIASDKWSCEGFDNEPFSDSTVIYSPYYMLNGRFDHGSVHYSYDAYGADDGTTYWYIVRDTFCIDNSLKGGDGRLTDYSADKRPVWEFDENWNDVTKVVVGPIVMSLGAYTFYGSDRIEQVIFKYVPESIGAYAFSGCSSLREIMASGYSGIGSIGDSAFCLGNEKSGVVSCDVHSDYNVLYGAFDEYKGEYTVFTYIDNSVDGTINFRFEGSKLLLWKNEHADSGAMLDYDAKRPLWESDPKWKNVIEVEIGKGITHIGNNAFSGNKNLEKVTVTSEARIVSIGSNAFANCERMVFVMDGTDALEAIGSYAFYNCSKVTFDSKGINLRHARSLTTIGDYAFCSTAGSDSLCIYENVKTIGASAFAGLSKLSTIYIYGDEWGIESIGDGAISLKKFATINVYSKDNFADHKLDQYSYCMFSYQSFSGSDEPYDELPEVVVKTIVVTIMVISLFKFFLKGH